ncbi:MAG: Ig domain-containing protein, partial [Terriglobales bacterium]
DSETPTAQTATKQLTITVNPQLSVTPITLAAGTVGTSYSQTLAATGGITPYSWAVTTGSLPAGLSLNASTGAITGKPTGPQVGAISFTVTVTDSESPTKTATANLSITISAPPLTITTNSLSTGVLNQSYSQTVQATGGVTPYTWSISSGSLPAGLSINGSTGAITGTPTATGTSTFTVQVTDVETPTEQTATKNLSITINNSAPLQVTTTSMPAGVINTSYTNGFLAASGGIQPYTWSISSGSLPAGLTLNASTGQISGTPSAQGTSSFTAKVTDSSTPTESATAGLSITINASLTITTTSVPNGSVGNQYNATVNASGGLTPYSWSLTSGSLPPGLNLNNNNSLGISGQPTTTGTYPFTLLVTDNQGDTASQGYTIVITTQPVGYTVSGTVTYSGSKTGWTYLELYSNNCNGCNNNLGTSISEATLTSTGAFTIHGVLPGTYTLQAFMDNLGYGAENASNPTATVGNITVTNAGVTGVTVALVDPATVTISSSPTWKSNNGLGAFNGGAFVSFQTINNNNGIEMPSSYTVEWSTSASCSSSNPSKSFPAMGGNNPWIVNGLTNGTTYYFCARGVAGSSTGPWSAPSSGITIGAPSGGNAVSGKVTFSETAKGPLYVGFYNQSTGAVYADVVGSKTSPPTSPASYSVSVPTGSDYYFFGVLDQGNSGLISGPGQVSNTNGHNNTPVSITGTTTNENLTLPNASSIAYVMTQTQEQISPGGTNTNYTIGFNVNGLLKLPVGVELATGPNPGAVIPADVANGSFGGNSDQFGYWTSLNGATPNVGDSYTLNVTYSDATSEVLTVTVAAVLNNAFATSLSPQGTGVSVTPNFSWTDPTNASSYTYQFQLSDSNNNTIWQIPSNNSNSNGFSSSITSITWDVDPTNSGDLPNVSALNGNSTYYWQMQTSDTNGDSAQVQVTFQTAAAPLTLPTAGSLGSTVVGQGFSGAINASGGVGPNYTFAVNGVSVPTDGSQNVIADGIWVSSTGGNTLSIGGTPTAVQTVTLTNVTVTDSASNTAGPDTYTITVSAASPLSIETTTMPGATEGWAYNSYIKANGGVQPYTWSVTSGSSSLNAVNLTFNGSPSNNQGNAEISGTPSATGTPSFTVQVTDNDGNTASQPLTIAVTGCTNNSKLTGNYALLLQGWTDSSEGEVFAGLAGSFVANGSGTISSGVADFNDPSDGYTELTFTGTYCVAPNNQGLMTFNPPSGNPMFLAFSLQSSGNGNIITYQSGDGFQGSGVLLKQTTTAFALSKITGPYAMGLIGVDQSGNRFGVAGAFTASGTADWTSGELDANDNGNINGGNGTSSPISFSSNDVSTVDSTTGRGTVGIDVSGVGTLNFAYYEVNATQLLLVQTDAISGPGGSLFTGQILQQSGTFTAASLDGVGVMEAEGLDTGSSPATADAQAGFVTTNGTSSISVTLDDNDGGTMSSQTSSGTYSVAPNGRVTTSFTGENHPPIIYLTAKNQAILLGSNGKVSFGTMTPQVGSSFTVSSLDGNYLGGSEEPTNSNVKSSVIQIDADGNGNLTGTQYEVQNCGSGCWQPDSSAIPAGLTYAPASGGPAGKFDINQDGVPQVYLYMISTTQAVIMNVGSSSGGSCNDGCNPSLTDFHQ